MEKDTAIGSQFLKEAREWLQAIVVALIVAMLTHIFIVQPTRVSGESMEDTLHNGDFLLISKWSHVMRDVPNYEDIVIIDSRVQRERSWKDDVMEPLMNYASVVVPSLQGHDVWVKRVIGRPGDTLEFKEGHVWRNGIKLNETYTKKETMKFERSLPIIVPEGHVFVMGDNRNHSSDSRFIGFVPVNHVLGKLAYHIRNPF